MPYEWKRDRLGNRRYVRLVDAVVTPAPEGGEMAIEPPDPPVAAKVETKALATPKASVKATAKPRKKRAAVKATNG